VLMSEGGKGAEGPAFLSLLQLILLFFSSLSGLRGREEGLLFGGIGANSLCLSEGCRLEVGLRRGGEGSR